MSGIPVPSLKWVALFSAAVALFVGTTLYTCVHTSAFGLPNNFKTPHDLCPTSECTGSWHLKAYPTYECSRCGRQVSVRP